jgi:hypothetical protein
MEECQETRSEFPILVEVLPMVTILILVLLGWLLYWAGRRLAAAAGTISVGGLGSLILSRLRK